MTYFHDDIANVARLSSGLPCPPIVARAWLVNEGQFTNNPTNPLNILYYGTGTQTGKIGRFATYASPAAGIDAAVSTIHRLVYYRGVRAAIAAWQTHPSNATIIGIARAIEDSPWAAGHYGGGGSRDGNIVKYVAAHLPPGDADYRLSLDQLTPVYDAPFGHLIGHVSKATYTVRRETLVNPKTHRVQHWYQVLSSQSGIRLRWLPAEPWFTLTAIP